MQALQTLIDKGSKLCGGDNALARKLGVSSALINMIKHGERTMTPQIAARLADLVGEDAMTAIAQATVEGERDPQMREVLKGILGKALAGGVAVMSLFSYGDASNTSSDMQATQQVVTTINRENPAIGLTLYTLYFWLRRALRGTGARIRERFPSARAPRSRHVIA